VGLLNDTLNLVFYAHEVCSTQDAAHNNDGACLGELIAVFSKRIGLNHHAPSGAILGCQFVGLFIMASDVVVLWLDIEHNLVFSKVAFLRQLSNLESLGAVYNSNCSFVVEVQELKRLESLLNSSAFEEDLAVQAGQNFANKDFVHKIGQFHIVEEVKEFLVVGVENKENQTAFLVC
jgi:hypothetical protein